MDNKDARRTIYVCVNMKDSLHTLTRIVKSDTYVYYIDATLQEEKDFRRIRRWRKQGLDIHIIFELPDGDDMPQKLIDGLKRACPLCNAISFYYCTNGVNRVKTYRLTNEENPC